MSADTPRLYIWQVGNDSSLTVRVVAGSVEEARRHAQRAMRTGVWKNETGILQSQPKVVKAAGFVAIDDDTNNTYYIDREEGGDEMTTSNTSANRPSAQERATVTIKEALRIYGESPEEHISYERVLLDLFTAAITEAEQAARLEERNRVLNLVADIVNINPRYKIIEALARLDNNLRARSTSGAGEGKSNA